MSEKEIIAMRERLRLERMLLDSEPAFKGQAPPLKTIPTGVPEAEPREMKQEAEFWPPVGPSRADWDRLIRLRQKVDRRNEPNRRRIEKERKNKAIAAVKVVATNRTFDSICPICNSTVPKQPIVCAAAWNRPVCTICLKKHKPLLYHALQEFYRKYPSFPSGDIAAAIKELSKAVGQSIAIPRWYFKKD